MGEKIYTSRTSFRSSCNLLFASLASAFQSRSDSSSSSLFGKIEKKHNLYDKPPLHNVQTKPQLRTAHLPNPKSQLRTAHLPNPNSGLPTSMENSSVIMSSCLLPTFSCSASSSSFLRKNISTSIFLSIIMYDCWILFYLIVGQP